MRDSDNNRVPLWTQLSLKTQIAGVKSIMPRHYVRVGGCAGYLKYRENQIEDALKDILHAGLSIRAAAAKHCVPYTTLQEHSKGKFTKRYGGQTALSGLQEKELADCLALCGDWGYPLDREGIKDVVHQYLEKKKIRIKKFVANRPGPDWMIGFLRRHRNLSERLAQNIKPTRGEISKCSIIAYFENLEESLRGVPPQNIVNFDETAFVDDPGRYKAIFRRGSRRAEKVIDHSKSQTCVMFAASAAGDILPPYVLYRAKYVYEQWTEGGPPNTRYDADERGWFNYRVFESWFMDVALPYFKKRNGLKVMLGDNLSCHLSEFVIKKCRENEIKFVLLPPNSTHLCQPLDVAWFKPMKIAWRTVLAQWKLKHRGVLPKTAFPKMLDAALKKVGERVSANAIAGFRACGIFPLNRSRVLEKLPGGSSERDRPGDNGTVFGQVLKEHLSSMRFNCDRGTTKRKRTRLRHAAGEDITVEVLQESSSPQDAPGNEPGPSSAEVEYAMESTDGIEDIDEGDFVLCKYETQLDGRERDFIGKITKITGDTIEILSLRLRRGSKQDYFFYPDILDPIILQRAGVQRRLNAIYGRRGQITFRSFNPRDFSL